jgi:hypothetical protein
MTSELVTAEDSFFALFVPVSSVFAKEETTFNTTSLAFAPL